MATYSELIRQLDRYRARPMSGSEFERRLHQALAAMAARYELKAIG